jgi:molybdate transport system substrate-binding protein
MNRAAAVAILVLAAAGTAASGGTQSPPGLVHVFAAASLKNALDDVGAAAKRETGVELRASYAASSALARQIEAGAPADIFISADEDWMNYVEKKGLMRLGTRVPLLGNRLVLIAWRDRPVSLRIAPGFAIAVALGDGRLAIADPAVVPAGKYAKAALASLGVWSSVRSRVAPADNVRAALLLVARGEAPLGIVYATDARAERDVIVVDTFPDRTHPPIVYPAALTAKASPAATRLLAFLQSSTARAIFARHGFAATGPS